MIETFNDDLMILLALTISLTYEIVADNLMFNKKKLKLLDFRND